MKEIEDLWNEIPQIPVKEDELISTLSGRSFSEVDKIKRILVIELYMYLGLSVIIVLVHENIGKEIAYLFYVTAFLCSLLNIVALKKIKKLHLIDDVKSFLKNALKVLKAFVTGFIITIQIVGIVVITAVKLLNQDISSWNDWVLSDQGISAIILFLLIEIALLSYAWIFYIKRIYSLKRILKEMEN